MEIQTNLFVDIKISPDYIDGSVLWWGLLEYWKHLVDYDLFYSFEYKRSDVMLRPLEIGMNNNDIH